MCLLRVITELLYTILIHAFRYADPTSIPDQSMWVRFVVNKVALGKVFLRLFQFYSVIIIPKKRSTLIFIYML